MSKSFAPAPSGIGDPRPDGSGERGISGSFGVHGDTAEPFASAHSSESSGSESSAEQDVPGKPGVPGMAAAPAFARNLLLDRLEETMFTEREVQAEQMRVLSEIVDCVAALDENPNAYFPTDRRSTLEFRSARADVALILGINERTAETHLRHAHNVKLNYPATFQSFLDGKIGYRHTTVIAEAGRVIGEDSAPESIFRRAAYEAQVLPVAEVESPNRLQPAAKVIAERFATLTLDERHVDANKRRSVCVVPQADGMADLIAHLPAVEAYAIADRISRIAKANKHAQEAAAKLAAEEGETRDAHGASRNNVGAGDERDTHGTGAGSTGLGDAAHESGSAMGRDALGREDRTVSRSMDEYRADTLIDLLLASTPGEGELAGLGIGAIRAQVQVVVPTRTLKTHTAADAPDGAGADVGVDVAAAAAAATGADCEEEWGSAAYFDTGVPPILPGYGPIDGNTARNLAGHAPGWDRIHAAPDTGDVLSVDRYRPSEALRRFLAARDLHCRFPGCRAPASRCDVDHTVDAQFGGETKATNLATLCRGHHLIKHHTAWKVKQDAGGILDWESPTGRRYRDAPQSRVMFVQASAESGAASSARNRWDMGEDESGDPPY